MSKPVKSIVFAFGRFQPPTIGHGLVVKTILSTAKAESADHCIYVSRVVHPKKDPLPVNTKIEYLQLMFPGVNFKAAKQKTRTFMEVMHDLFLQKYTQVTMIAGSDRTDEFRRLLNKYNNSAEYSFDKIEVVSAGQRDPDEEGAAGMSGTKMREAAVKDDFANFRRGIPSTLNDRDTRKLMEKIKAGMHLNESVGNLVEGVNDAGIFKVVFLAGGPGSGKDFLLKKSLDGHGLVELNSDKALEFLMDKGGLDKRMPAAERETRDIVRSKAKSVTELRQRLAIEGRNGLIINGTGDNPEKLIRIKKQLEELGYTSAMIFVNTSDKISQERNIARGQHGGREVPELIRKQKWDQTQAALPILKKEFGNTITVFDNSADLQSKSAMSDEERTVKIKELAGIWKKMKEFTTQHPEDPVAQDWIHHKLGKRGELSHVRKSYGLDKNTSKKMDDNSDTKTDAEKLGLKYYGFGRYGKEGHVTYRSENGKLAPVKPTTISISSTSTSSGSGTRIKESTTMIDILAKKYSVLPAKIMEQLEYGLTIETRHTQDIEEAIATALHHIDEQKDYYVSILTEKISLSKLRKKIRETSFSGDNVEPGMFGTNKEVNDVHDGGRATNMLKNKL